MTPMTASPLDRRQPPLAEPASTPLASTPSLFLGDRRAALLPRTPDEMDLDRQALAILVRDVAISPEEAQRRTQGQQARDAMRAENIEILSRSRVRTLVLDSQEMSLRENSAIVADLMAIEADAAILEYRRNTWRLVPLIDPETHFNQRQSRDQAAIDGSPWVKAWRAWIRGDGAPIENMRVLAVEDDLWGKSAGIERCVARSRWHVEAIGYAAPPAPLIRGIASIGPVIELGAGSGFTSHLVNAAGGCALATDLHPDAMAIWAETSRAVVRMGASEATLANPDRALLIVWPDPSDMDWVEAAVALARPGTPVVFIGEPEPGAKSYAERLKTLRSLLCFEDIGAMTQGCIDARILHSLLDGGPDTIFFGRRK